MRFAIDQYYKDEPMTKLDKGLFVLASYNAGPARVAKLRKEAASIGLDLIFKLIRQQQAKLKHPVPQTGTEG